MEGLKNVWGILECATLGVTVVQIGDEVDQGQVEARRLIINQRHYVVEGMLEPFPHVGVIELPEQ